MGQIPLSRAGVMHFSIRVGISLVASMAFAIQLFAQQEARSESGIYVPRDSGTETDKKAQKKKPTGKASTTPSDTITIPVTVLSADGKLILSLPPTAFEAEIGGKPTTIREVKKYDGPLEIALLLDLSPSAGAKLDELKKLALRVVANFSPQDRITLATFNRDFKVVVRSSTDRRRIENAIRNVAWDSGTRLYDTIGDLFEKTLTEPYPHAVIVVTDGVDTTSKTYTYQSSLLAAERRASKVFVIYLDTYGMLARTPVTVGPTPSSTYQDLTGDQDPGRTIVIRSSALETAPPPPARRVVGMTAAEYERGNQYLTDLINLSGGRPILASNVLAGRSVALDSIPYELANQYYLVIEKPAQTILGKRHSLKVRVKFPGLVINTKGSLID